MGKKVFVLICLLLLSVNMYAQNAVSGYVRDEGRKGIEGATVCLYRQDQLYAMSTTNAKGFYNLEGVETNSYRVVACCPGYKDVEKTITVTDACMQDFVLQEDARVLDSVTVYGERMQRTTKGYVYYLSEKARKCGNPFVALEEIPLLVTDPAAETVKSADGQSLVILVDGMSVNSGISPIDPSRIKSVEINDILSAKYMRNGAKRILNIKTRDTAYYLYDQTAARVDVPWGYRFVQNNFEVGNNRLSFFGGLFSSYDRSKTEQDYSMSSADFTRWYRGKGEEKSWGYIDYDAMLKWKMSRKDWMVLSIQGMAEKTEGRFDADGMRMDSPLHLANRDDYMSHRFAATIYYKHIFKEDETLEVNAVYTDNRSDNTGVHDETGDSGTNSYWQRYDNKRRKLEAESTYSKDFESGASLTVGNTLYMTHDMTDNTAPDDGFTFDHKRLNDLFYAGYHDWLTDKILYQLNLGMEYDRLSSAYQTKEYLNPYVNAKIEYRPDRKLTFTAGYRYRNTSPDIGMLNPANTSSDTLLVSMGNPHLSAQKNHSVSLGMNYQKNKIYTGISLSGDFKRQMIEQVCHAEDNGVLVSSYDNTGRFSSFSASAFFSYNSKRIMLQTNSSLNLNHYTLSGNKCYSVSSLYLRYRLSKKLHVLNQLTYQNVSYTKFSKTRYFAPTWYLNLTYSFNNNAYLRVGLKNVLGNSRTRTTVKTGNYESCYYQKNKMFTPMILFRWTFRKNEKKQINIDESVIKDLDEKIKF